MKALKEFNEYYNGETYKGHATQLYDSSFNKSIDRIFGNMKIAGRKRNNQHYGKYSYIKYKEDLFAVHPPKYKKKVVLKNEGHLREKSEIIEVTRTDEGYWEWYDKLPSAPVILTCLEDGTEVNMWHPFGDVYVNTEFGVGYINNSGYIQIQASNNYRGELLHRLIYEKEYGFIPSGYHIHHIDKNPLNNCLDNLEALTPYEHAQKHRRD